jgi:zinc transport system substrate-binding protein
VVGSFYPMSFLATQIGGDKWNVVNLIPAGAEPHDYEPTSSDWKTMTSATLIILNGTIEPWGNKVVGEIGNKAKVVTVGTTGNTGDPHVWLSLAMYKKQAVLVTNAFSGIDPGNKNYYDANLKALLGKLDALIVDYQKGLASCKNKEIITTHEAFSYLAAEFGLQQVAITGLTPDAEPSISKLESLVKLARAKNIKYIFFESLVSPKLATTLANEIGAQTLVLNPLEGLTKTEVANGANYLTVMEDNLHNLRKALQCK